MVEPLTVYLLRDDGGRFYCQSFGWVWNWRLATLLNKADATMLAESSQSAALTIQWEVVALTETPF